MEGALTWVTRNPRALGSKGGSSDLRYFSWGSQTLSLMTGRVLQAADQGLGATWAGGGRDVDLPRSPEDPDSCRFDPSKYRTLIIIMEDYLTRDAKCFTSKSMPDSALPPSLSPSSLPTLPRDVSSNSSQPEQLNLH